MNSMNSYSSIIWPMTWCHANQALNIMKGGLSWTFWHTQCTYTMLAEMSGFGFDPNNMNSPWNMNTLSRSKEPIPMLRCDLNLIALSIFGYTLVWRAWPTYNAELFLRWFMTHIMPLWHTLTYMAWSSWHFNLDNPQWCTQWLIIIQ